MQIPQLTNAKHPFVAALVAAAVLFGADVRAQEPLPPGMKVVKVEAQPAAITLKHRFDYAQLLLTGQLETGERIDVTRMARIDGPAHLVRVSPTGLVRPVADGAGALTCTVAGQALTVPVTVSGQKETPPVSFVRDVMPALSKMGCNAGTCHGAAQGKNGF